MMKSPALEPVAPNLDAMDDKRAAIVAAAIPVFASEGFEKARIADIALAAKVGKGTVYEYFRSKEELLLAACIASCLRNQSELEKVLGQVVAAPVPAHEKATKVLHRTISTLLEIVLTRTVADIRLFLDLTSVGREQPAFLSQARAQMVKLYESWEDGFASIYRIGVERGEFRKLPQPGLLALLFSAVLDGLVWQVSWRADLKPNELAARTAELYIHLLVDNPKHLPELMS